jgi:hypothetical protein
VGNPGTDISDIALENIDLKLKNERLQIGETKNITVKNVTVNGQPFSLEK